MQLCTSFRYRIEDIILFNIIGFHLTDWVQVGIWIYVGVSRNPIAFEVAKLSRELSINASCIKSIETFYFWRFLERIQLCFSWSSSFLEIFKCWTLHLCWRSRLHIVLFSLVTAAALLNLNFMFYAGSFCNRDMLHVFPDQMCCGMLVLFYIFCI